MDLKDVLFFLIAKKKLEGIFHILIQFITDTDKKQKIIDKLNEYKNKFETDTSDVNWDYLHFTDDEKNALFNSESLTLDIDCDKTKTSMVISKTLFWKYPIEGITEVKSKGIDFTFKTKAKKIFETKIYLDLSNLLEKDIDFSDFVYILNIKEEKYKSLINKCLSINFVDQKKAPNEPQNLSKLPLDIKFYPLRPFKTDIEFVLRKKSGGQWIYNIILESTEPDPDDIIHIKSSLNKQSFVAFKLQNIFTKDAKFVAYFSHDSSSEFSVSPREGILDQSGRDGTQFVVSYLPVEYGKIKVAKLIIETEEVQWVFEVRGSHLDYKPPEVKRTSLYKETKASEIRNKFNENIRKEKK